MEATWFGPRLRELREARGLTQPQLAQAAGLTKDGLARLERGERLPAWDTIISLCRALGVDCTAFTQEPANSEPRGPGRPKKAEASTEESEPKKGTKTRKRKEG